MKVKNMTSNKGNKIANQFIIEDVYANVQGTMLASCDVFQSYDSIIVVKDLTGRIFLDSDTWNYSPTTSKYRNIFLGESTKETQKKIGLGVYKLVNLN